MYIYIIDIVSLKALHYAKMLLLIKLTLTISYFNVPFTVIVASLLKTGIETKSVKTRYN